MTDPTGPTTRPTYGDLLDVNDADAAHLRPGVAAARALVPAVPAEVLDVEVAP